MRFITDIFVHCTAGFGDVESIKRFWKSKGWREVGYHFFVYENGKEEQLADLDVITNGVVGFNKGAIHIAYQGGVDRRNVKIAKDTRTDAQKEKIIILIEQILNVLKNHQDISKIRIRGHRDASPDKNGNGVIESWERIKECPSFDAIPEYKHIITKLTTLIILCCIPFIGCKTSKTTTTTVVSDSSHYSLTYQERDTSISTPVDFVSTLIQCKDSIIYLLQPGIHTLPVGTNPILIYGNKQAGLSAQNISGTNFYQMGCKCDTLSIQAKIRDSFKSSSQSKSEQIKVQVPVKYIPRLILILACIGGGTVLLSGFIISYKILKLIS